MQGRDKDFIRRHVLDEYYPEWSELSYDAIKPDYRFNETVFYEVTCSLPMRATGVFRAASECGY